MCVWLRTCSCKKSRPSNRTSDSFWTRAKRRPTGGPTAGARSPGALPRAPSSGGWRPRSAAGAGSWSETWRNYSVRSECCSLPVVLLVPLLICCSAFCFCVVSCSGVITSFQKHQRSCARRQFLFMVCAIRRCRKVTGSRCSSHVCLISTNFVGNSDKAKHRFELSVQVSNCEGIRGRPATLSLQSFPMYRLAGLLELDCAVFWN